MKRKNILMPALIALAFVVWKMVFIYGPFDEKDRSNEKISVVHKSEREIRDDTKEVEFFDGDKVKNINGARSEDMRGFSSAISSGSEDVLEEMTDKDLIEKKLAKMNIEERFNVLRDCGNLSFSKLELARQRVNSKYLDLLAEVCTQKNRELTQEMAIDLANEPEMLAQLEDWREESRIIQEELDNISEENDSIENELEKIRFLFGKLYKENCVPCGDMLISIVRDEPKPLAEWLGVPVSELSRYDKLRPDYFYDAYLFVHCSNGILDCSPDSYYAALDCLNDTSVCGYDRITGLQMRIGSDNMTWVVTLANFFLAVSGYPVIDHPVLPRDDPDAEP